MTTCPECEALKERVRELEGRVRALERVLDEARYSAAELGAAFASRQAAGTDYSREPEDAAR